MKTNKNIPISNYLKTLSIIVIVQIIATFLFLLFKLYKDGTVYAISIVDSMILIVWGGISLLAIFFLLLQRFQLGKFLLLACYLILYDLIWLSISLHSRTSIAVHIFSVFFNAACILLAIFTFLERNNNNDNANAVIKRVQKLGALLFIIFFIISFLLKILSYPGFEMAFVIAITIGLIVLGLFLVKKIFIQKEQQ